MLRMYNKTHGKFCCGVLVLCLGAMFSVAVRANDTSIGDENGSIVFLKQNDISMTSESLFITDDLVRVDYIFTNKSDAPLRIPMAFPMPPMRFNYPGDYGAVTDFKLWVNGKRVATERKLIARASDGTDLGPELRRRGWNEKKLLAWLEQLPAAAVPATLPTHWFNEDEPLFSMQEYFFWEQTFPARQPVRIQHQYSPSVTTGVPMPASELINNYAKNTCMDAEVKRALQKREGKYGLGWRYLQYVLTTGNNWKNAIEQFSLRIQKKNPAQVISLCFDGELKKVDARTFEFQAQHYRPTREINILFAEKLPEEP